MDNKVLINQLSLAYSPLCNYDFSVLKTDPVVQEVIERSSLYIIGQRPEVRFDNIVINEDEAIMEFEIKQIGNPNTLTCKVPLNQKNIATDETNKFFVYLGSNIKNNDFNIRPINNVHGIKIYHDEHKGANFLIWFSPEKFLHNYWNDHLVADIQGDIYSFTKYKVHYVGQATKQDVWKRLTGHSKLQDILSLEYPFSYGSLPTHEIVILLYCFKDNMQISTFGYDSDVDEMVNTLLGKNMPEQRTIFLDAEKALINAMQPNYNDELFNNYPKSADGLYSHNYDSISYSFTDPITLVYDKGEIVGGLTSLGGDSIIIQSNETVKLLKLKAKPLGGRRSAR